MLKKIVFLLLLLLLPISFALHPYIAPGSEAPDLNQPIYQQNQGQTITPQTYEQNPQNRPVFSLNNVLPSYGNIDLTSDGNIIITLNKKNSQIQLGLKQLTLANIDINFLAHDTNNALYLNGIPGSGYIRTDGNSSTTARITFAKSIQTDSNILMPNGVHIFRNDIGGDVYPASIVIGNSSATENQSVTVGDSSNNSGFLATLVGSNSIVGGANSCSYAVSIGNQQILCGTTPSDATIGIGEGVLVNGNGAIAIGETAQANSNYALAIGGSSKASNINSCAIGKNVIVNGQNSCGIGNDFTVSDNNVFQTSSSIKSNGDITGNRFCFPNLTCITNNFIDTNWQTSWTVFDSNMRNYYLDINRNINQTITGSKTFNNAITRFGNPVGDLTVSLNYTDDTVSRIDWNNDGAIKGSIYDDPAGNGFTIYSPGALTLNIANELSIPNGLSTSGETLFNNGNLKINTKDKGIVWFDSSTNKFVSKLYYTGILLGGKSYMDFDMNEQQTANSFRFNPKRLDTNFSVSTKTNANALLIDSGSDKIGIMKDNPQTTLDVNGNVNIDGNLSVKRPFGMFSSTKTFTIGNTTVAYPIDFNTTERSYQILKNTVDTNAFSVQQKGEYLIEISIIAQSSIAGKRVNIWVRKEGIDVPRSNTSYDFKSTSAIAVIAVPFIIDLNTTDRFSIMYSGDSTGISLPTIQATTSPPAPVTPSAIITITKLSDIPA